MDAPQHIKGAKGDILGMTDGRGDHIQARGEGLLPVRNFRRFTRAAMAVRFGAYWS